MYTKEIIMLLIWPLSVYLTFLLIKWAIKKFDHLLK